ncbi:MnhB domain-containing protein [Dethiobacter alkaliphilus]|uniref:Na+/H+ antiporter MnhB subunit-related protein n=1 Tax=Dethiobacter alkaliphilus AHT 1 TaxID=555088 RepID=C0GEX3_DETAL|nr:MnhB domain-containing protein [Dethiobacter alkaliphilus]EEG78155.1 Na+/H+ antiporter MnhB subunit-related protein [Dethiobacter alkaliphilus AHT 1]
MEDVIVRYISRIILPFVQLYGLYVVVHGHLSPGGGFSGGAIIGASMILFALSFNLKEGSKKISHDVSTVLESGGAVLFATIGIAAIFMGTNFLGNRAAGFPMGELGDLFSAGAIPIITFGLGIKVASTMITLFYSLIEGEEDHSHDHH